LEPVLRAIGCYLLLLFVVRLSGKRGLAQITIFDLVLLLLISQTVGQALIGDDSSLTTAAIIAITLVVINRANDTIAHRWADMSHVLEDAPLILIENGVVHEDRMTRMKIRLDDILENGRLDEGVERLDQIKHAILVDSGAISIIAKQGDDRRRRSVSRRLRSLPSRRAGATPFRSATPRLRWRGEASGRGLPAAPPPRRRGRARPRAGDGTGAGLLPGGARRAVTRWSGTRH